jgi:RNA polymerase sigma factor (TIGR02999 family)
MNAVTQLLASAERGDPRAAEQLLPLVYDELRRLAAQKLRHEGPGHTLQPTALVHEAYLRLVPSSGREAAEDIWDSRGHFFAAAAEAMRRILIDSARRRQAIKRGGTRAREDVGPDLLAIPEPREDLFALDEALDRLAVKDPVKAQLVKLRYFAGLTSDEAARALGISPATAERYWAYARAWLHQEIAGKDPTSS